jgi:C-terminal processing protease CtpA/Prc
MRRLRRTLATLVAVTLALATQARAQAGTAPAPGTHLIAAADARADLDALRAAIFEAHGAPFRFVPRAELERRWDGYRAGITGPVTELELLAAASRMMTDLGDGHARATTDSATSRRIGERPLFPLRVRVEYGNRLFVVRNDTPADTTVRPGDEVLEVNGRRVRDLIAQFTPLQPIDGVIATGRAASISRNFARLFYHFADQRTTYDLVVRDAAGRERRARLDGVTDAARQTNANPVNEAYLVPAARLDGSTENVGVRFPGDGRVAVMRVHGFFGDRLLAELDSVAAVARERGARAMVLDLRGNGGGADMGGARLVAQFARGPFRYFDHIHMSTLRPSFTTFKPKTYEDLDAGTRPDPAGGWLVQPVLHPGVAEQQPVAQPFTGPLVVLEDGYTFSTAADVTATLRGLGLATFVGEESGGAYEGNTSGTSGLLYLPHSGIRVSIQMYGYVNAVPAPRVRARGTMADVEVPLHVSDIVRGADPGMERALSIARERAGKQP